MDSRMVSNILLWFGKGGSVALSSRLTFPISVLSMGAVFAMFSGFIHWFPLFTGLTLHKRWATAHFFMMLVGVNLTFFPQHFLGLAGMPRRISDYPDAFAVWNMLSSYGAMMSYMSSLFFMFILWEALASQRPAIAVARVGTSGEWGSVFPYKTHADRRLAKYVGRGKVGVFR